jgi:hypothetical protein
VEHAIAEGFIRAEHRALIVSSDTGSDDLLDRLAAYAPQPAGTKWTAKEPAR